MNKLIELLRRDRPVFLAVTAIMYVTAAISYFITPYFTPEGLGELDPVEIFLLTTGILLSSLAVYVVLMLFIENRLVVRRK